jgi:hypothetical protein
MIIHRQNPNLFSFIHDALLLRYAGDFHGRSFLGHLRL